MDSRNLTVEEQTKLSPKEVRLMSRRGEWPAELGTAYCCAGYAQLAPFIIPKEYAFEFLTFCQRNPRAMYVAEILDPGDPHPQLLATDADIRTDIARYRVYEYGELVDEPEDIMKYWRDDLVTFFLNCSYGFEGVLRSLNIKFRNMGCYITNIPAIPAGRFQCDNSWATCRLFSSRRDAIRAIQVTSRLPISHGCPIHIGDPAYIGIKDIMKPDECESIQIGTSVVYAPPTEPPKPNEVMLYWHCALTPEIALKNAKLPFAIQLYPSRLFISDHLTEEFAYTQQISPNLP